MTLALIQTSIPIPSLSLGEWLGIITALIVIVGAIYKLGAVGADARALRSSLEAELKSIRDVLKTITEYIAEAQRIRIDWSGFRKVTEDATALHTEEIGELKKAGEAHTHQLRNVEQAVALVSARVGVVEKRHYKRRAEDREGDES